VKIHFLFLLVLIGALAAVHADDQRNLVRLKKRDLENPSVGIMPVVVSDYLAMDVIWRNFSLSGKKEKLLSILYKNAPEHLSTVSLFSRTVICTSSVAASVALKERTFTFTNGKKIEMPLPADDSPIATTEPVDYLLFLFVDFAYDNRDTTYLSWDEMSFFGPLPKSDVHPVEECINFGYRYAIWSRQKTKIVSVGSGTAEACARPSDRYGKFGVFYLSIEDLFKQVVDETPFDGMKDASDFR
jgi:hypothetical protein